jgi:hypothetical protein
MACVPSVSPPNTGQGDLLVGTPTDDFGCYLNNKSPQSKHTYNGIQEMPSAWGGGPKGSLMRVSHSGGKTNTQPDGDKQGYAATYRYDLSQEFHTGPDTAIHRITGNSTYTYNGTTISHLNDAPNSCVDYERQGWWCKPRQGTPSLGQRLSFTDKDGNITSYTSPLKDTDYGQMYVFEDEDLLVHIAHEIWMTVRPPSPAAGWVRATQDPPATSSEHPSKGGTKPAVVGYMGMRWCSHPNYNCFIGISMHDRIDDTHVKIWILTPPPVGQRKTGSWTWSYEIITSGDGSIMRAGVAAGDDAAVIQGSFGKLFYCPPLKSLVWTRRQDAKGQLIRLANMT